MYVRSLGAGGSWARGHTHVVLSCLAGSPGMGVTRGWGCRDVGGMYGQEPGMWVRRCDLWLGILGCRGDIWPGSQGCRGDGRLRIPGYRG